MSIGFLGDTHAISQHYFKFLQSSNASVLIQLGDFGFIWTEEDVKRHWFLDHFEKQFPNKIILTVLGNHENYDVIMNLPEVEIFGGKAFQIRKNIFAIKRGEILSIEGMKILCIGGADSHDKEWRIEHEIEFGMRQWWPQECILDSDIKNALENLKKVDYKVDCICSHCEPPSFIIDFFNGSVSPSPSEERLTEILAKTKFDYWLGGHVHASHSFETQNGTISSLAIGEYWEGYLNEFEGNNFTNLTFDEI